MKLIFFILLMTSGLMAQTDVTYVYDAAGNRIHRESLAFTPDDSPEFRGEEVSRRITLSVFPNPATAILNVNIQEYDSTIPGEITLHDAAGRIVRTLPLLTSRSELDIANLPSATYHLKIIYGELRRGWTVTKLD